MSQDQTLALRPWYTSYSCCLAAESSPGVRGGGWFVGNDSAFSGKGSGIMMRFFLPASSSTPTPLLLVAPMLLPL